MTQCILEDEMLNPEDYPLRDTESEKRIGFSLAKTRELARKNNHRLLEGKTMYCVENINGGYDAYKSIIETNGGQCILFRGRGLVIPTRRTVGDGDDNHGAKERDEVYLISGTEKSHVKLWPKFRKLVQDAKRIPRIVPAQWLLDVAMSQEWRSADVVELKDEDVEMING